MKYKLDRQWSVFGEAQIRSLKFYNNFHYYEYKGGLSYKLENIGFSLGVGSYQTYQEAGNFMLPKNNNEFRIWPQITLSQKILGLNIEQRYRSEFRFTSNGYRDRFRYRFGMGKALITLKDHYPLYLSGNAEIFLTSRRPHFERIRSAISLSHEFNKHTAIQAGYLYQFDYRLTDEIGRKFFQLGYTININ